MTKIYHIHIRKTAGTVIHDLLKKQFQKQQACPFRSEIDLKCKVPLGERLSTINQYPLISGHFYSFGKQLMPEYKIVTFLRHPIARTVSAFNHMKYSKKDLFHDKLKGLTLSESLQSNFADQELKNGQTRFLIGNAGYDYNNLDQHSVSTAITFIDQLFFVGIQELMNPSIHQLTKLLNIDQPKRILHTNTKVTASGIKVNTLSSSELKLIKEYNAYDLQIYEYARKKLETQLDQQLI